MVKREQGLDATFAALADPSRRRMIERLSRGETTVGELARPLELSLPAVSKHLRVLERAGLLRQERDGRVRRCRLRPQPLRSAASWIARYERFWSAQLDALAKFVEQQVEGAPIEAPSIPVSPSPSEVPEARRHPANREKKGH
jgi:DNA-binding transcriptional ArsR family regulator